MQQTSVTVNQATARKVAPWVYVVAILFFLLPFTTISCSSAGGPKTEIVNLTGVEMVTGKDLPSQSASSAVKAGQKNHYDSNIWAILALGSIAVGTVGSFVRTKISRLVPVFAGIAGFVFLIVMKINLDNAALESSRQSGMSGISIIVEYQLGYWGALLLSALASGITVYVLLQEGKEKGVANLTPGKVGSPTEPW